jgi:microcystin-dependent protein
MADITIVKFKVRRGTDSERERVVLDQGEIGYTIDTKRLFVGDGALSGGNVVGSKNFGAFNLESGLGGNVGAQIGDFGYAKNKLYALSAEEYTSALSGWSYIGVVPDDANIEFNGSNQLTIKLSSIDGNDLMNEAFGKALVRNGQAIDVNFNTDYFELSGGFLTPLGNSVTEREIKSTALSAGLSGGNGEPLVVNIGKGLIYEGGRVAAGPAESSSVLFSALDPNIFGNGLNVNLATKTVNTTLCSVDGNSFNVNNSTISLVNKPVSGNYEAPFLSLNGKGIVENVQSTFFDTMTATSLTGADFVPVGTILPHARAIGAVPHGFVLCDGAVYSQTGEFSDLYNAIGTNYNTGGEGGTNFRVPNLTGGQFLYGNNQNPDFGTAGSKVYYLSARQADSAFVNLSAVDTTFIIKATSVVKGVFTGAPNQVSNSYQHDGSTYTAKDSNGNLNTLSSAGFLTLALSGTTRNTSQTFDRYAIPIFNY